MKKLLSVMFLSFIVSHAYAQDLSQLVAKLDAWQNLQADFTQSTADESGAVLQSITGKLAIQKPHKFFWQADEPVAQTLVSNGKIIWHYDSDLEQVVIQDYAKQSVQSPLMQVLDNTSELGKHYRLVNNSSSNKDAKNNSQTFYTFYLEPIQQAQVKNISLSFNGDVIERLSFTDQAGQVTEVMLSNGKQAKQPESTFEFVVPDGVDVLYE